MPQPFESLPIRLRPTESSLLNLELNLNNAKAAGRPESDLELLRGMIDEVKTTLGKERELTEPIPVYLPAGTCNSGNGLLYQPAKDTAGNNIAFTKSILLLTDNFTISSAEMFSAVLQDQNRALVYGVRTVGGGGYVVEYDFMIGPYSQGSARVTQSIAVRNHNISTPGLPGGPYIENIGIQPDFRAEFNTKNNLLTGGQPFVNGFMQAISGMINSVH
jgi:hypothetical protein